MLYRDWTPHRTAIFSGQRLWCWGPLAFWIGLLPLLLTQAACRGRPGASGAGGAGPAHDGDVLRGPILRAPAQGTLSPAALASLSLEIDGVLPLPLYDAAPDHPWNRVHHALYMHPFKVFRTSCHAVRPYAAVLNASTGCASRSVPLDPWPPSVEGFADYADSASLLASPEVRHLAEPARAARLLALLQAASDRATEKTQRPWAALSFQSDLWERFDALDAAARVLTRTDGPPGASDSDRQGLRDRLLWLRDAVGRLLHAVALPADQIRSLDGNLTKLSAEFPLLLPDFPGPAWVEIVTRSRSRPEPLPASRFEYTRHASVAGFRSVFRRFVHVPADAGGTAWLNKQLSSEPSAPTMPPGTRMVILQQPLAVAEGGSLVLWPRTDLVELRTVDIPLDSALQQAPPKRLAELKFDVLEGSRSLLRQRELAGSGLHRLPADAPFPMGGSCAPQPTVLAPLRVVCMTCHPAGGSAIHGAMTHGPQRTRVLEDPELPVRAVRDEKQQRPDFNALRSLI